MKMKKYTLTVLALLASSAFAQSKPPSYAEARKFYDQLGRPVAETGVWHQKSPAARIKANQDANLMVKRAEQLFGVDPMAHPKGLCLQAAMMMREYVSNLSSIVRIAEGSDRADVVTLLNMTRTGSEFGEKRANCYEYVESLDTGAKK
jgi:hypothetical protein